MLHKRHCPYCKKATHQAEAPRARLSSRHFPYVGMFTNMLVAEVHYYVCLACLKVHAIVTGKEAPKVDLRTLFGGTRILEKP